MRHGFWTSISRIAITSVAAMVVVSGLNHGSLFAQTQPAAEEQKPKTTKEPVFRVSKLNDPNRTNKTGEIFPPKKLLNEDRAKNNSDRVADSSALPTREAVSNPTAAVGPAAAMPVATPTNNIPSVNLPPTNIPPVTATAPAHPLDRAVEIAQGSLQGMRAEVFDYTAILKKVEQVKGVIGSPSYISIKVRCPRTLADGSKTPFSLYMKFLKPRDSAGREVIWVDGQNEGKIVAHEASGILSMRRMYLDPDGFIAMRGQRYPIYEAGLENLIVKLIEKAERDRAAGPCHVDYRSGAEVNKRPCSLIELVHDVQHGQYEFHKAQVYIDDELQLPVRYAAYDWPTSPGGEPRLLEQYTYYNVKVNVGLTDRDFSPSNSAYRFPKR